jgi:hypothetical protein
VLTRFRLRNAQRRLRRKGEAATGATLGRLGRATCRIEIQSADGVWWGRHEDVEGVLYELVTTNLSGQRKSLVLVPDKPFAQSKAMPESTSNFIFVSKLQILGEPNL